MAERIAAVIRDLDVDILGICEGPPLKEQMETFVREKLGGDYTVHTMEDDAQSVHTLVHRRLPCGSADSGMSRSGIHPPTKTRQSSNCLRTCPRSTSTRRAASICRVL